MQAFFLRWGKATTRQNQFSLVTWQHTTNFIAWLTRSWNCPI